MSSVSVIPILNTLQSQLSAGELDAANDTFTELSGKYTEREAQDELAFGRSKALRESGSVSGSLKDQLDAFENLYYQVELYRASVLGGVSFFFIDPTEASNSEVTSEMSKAIEVEKSFQGQLDELESELDSADVPPDLNIVATELSDTSVFLGDSTSVEVTVQNIGSDEASDVMLEVTGSDVSVSPASQSLGDIGAAGTVTTSVTVSSDSQGVNEVEITATSSNAGTSSKTARVPFTTIIEVLENRVGSLEELEEAVSSSVLSGDVKDGLIDKLDAAIESIERAISSLESSGRGGPPPERSLNAAINQLGAYLNQIDAVSDKISRAYEWRLRVGGETNIDELAAVRERL